MNSAAILPRTPPPTTTASLLSSPSLPPRFRLHSAVAAASSSPIPRSPRRRTPPLLSSSSPVAAAVVGVIRGGGRRRPGGGGSRCVVRCGAMEITESEFSDAVLMSDRPVLVEFVADWCGPCRLVAPAVEAVAQEYGDRLTVVKIDHDANPKLIEEFKVYGLPALILFKDGKEVPESRREGAITKAKLKEYIESLLNSSSVV